MQQTSKTPKGQVSIQEDKGRLRVRFPRELFGGKLKVMALNLPATKRGYEEAQRRINAIQSDIDLNKFDPTLERYKPQAKQQEYIKLVANLHPDIDLKTLWGRYFEYRKPNLKESTINYLQTSVTNYLEKSKIESPYQALELRQWLLENTTQSMAKRILTYVNAAFKWGLKHKLVKGSNPYDGMATELKHHYQIETKPNAFSPEQKQKIIEAFTNHKGNWNNRVFTGKAYSHYASFVKFLLFTGCRPSEAIGLRWGDISKDFKKIIFDGSIYQLPTGKKIRIKGSKNNKKREFPCNLELQTLLQEIKPEAVSSDSLVFPSPTGKPISYNTFCHNAWSKIVDPIKPDTTPYCCRDTFITEQIAKGVNPAIVAKWSDTSTGMIERHYLDSMNLSHILPQ